MRFALIFPVVVSACSGALAMYVAWHHNPQCEIHCEGLIHWGYWLLIGASWAGIALVSVGALSLVVAKIHKNKGLGKNT